MRLTKNGQYALALLFYLHQNGKTSVSQVCSELGLSTHFMEQIARKLRISGILKVFRGPGGGYEVIGEPIVREVFKAVGIKPFLSAIDRGFYDRSDRTELRSIAHCARVFNGAAQLMLDRKVKNIMAEMIINQSSRASSFYPTRNVQ